MTQTIIGIMGPGNGASSEDIDNAYTLGKLIAKQGWTLLTGGRNVGVMEAASKGANAANGLVIGILPTANQQGISKFVDIPILTDLGNARNNINVLSSHAIIACGMGLGTASEVALALKNGRTVILLTKDQKAINFFTHLSPHHVHVANTPQEALEQLITLVNHQSG